jgi:hypothetical protein
MNESPEIELLQDLAKLLCKHGPDVFEKLAQQLDQPEVIERLRQILSTGAKVARQSGMTQPPRRSSNRSLYDYRLSLLGRQESDPEKSALLVRLFDDLMAKTLLPTMRELRTFAESSGLESPKSSVRPKAIVEIIEGIRERSLEELRQVVVRLPLPGGPSDRSLENWTRIIFDKELRSRKAE